MALIDVIRTKTFSIIFSLMLGLALASFFRRACKGRACVIVKAPNPQQMTSGYYKFSGKCYKFKTDVANCADGSNQENGIVGS